MKILENLKSKIAKWKGAYSVRLHAMVIIFWPSLLWATICLLMAVYYGVKPNPEPIGLGFNVIKDIFHNWQYGILFAQLGLVSVPIAFICLARKL